MIDRLNVANPEYAEQADELKAMALEYAEKARIGLAQSNELVMDYVQKQPMRALGIAIGLGVALGWLIKRR